MFIHHIPPDEFRATAHPCLDGSIVVTARDICISSRPAVTNAARSWLRRATAIYSLKFWSECAGSIVSWRFGYVVMPEHVHLWLSEPERGDLSVVMQVIKQSFARRYLRLHSHPPIENRDGWGSLNPDSAQPRENHIWQARFYDLPVFTEAKKAEKLGYMHRNPVKRGLVSEPGQWKWSSFRDYACGEPGTVLLNEAARAEMRLREVG
jgi:REP element-mobilizing transposase RayT